MCRYSSLLHGYSCCFACLCVDLSNVRARFGSLIPAFCWSTCTLAAEASGRGEASSSLQASMQPYGKAAAVEDKAVTHAANTYFLQEPDSR